MAFYRNYFGFSLQILTCWDSFLPFPENDTCIRCYVASDPISVIAKFCARDIFYLLLLEPVACKIYRTCDAIGNTNNECVATICTLRHEIREEKLKPTHDLFVFTSYTTEKRNKGNSCKLKNCRINTTNALLSSL